MTHFAHSVAPGRIFIAPLGRFIHESPSRVPLTDFYGTTDGKQEAFQARSVVGGIYLPLLASGEMRPRSTVPLQPKHVPTNN
jgi:hypothetical protein